MESIDLVDYSRQVDLTNSAQALDDIVNRNTHLIVGCGGIGYWLAISLAMMGVQDFILIDGQTIEESNLNRLPVPQTWIGTNKAIALRKMIRFLRPATRIVCLNAHITDETLDIIPRMLANGYANNIHNVWDTTDNAIIQRKIYDFVVKLKETKTVRYRKIGYEAWKVGNYAKWDIWTDEDEYQAGYRTSSANSITSMLSAGLGIFAMGLNRQDDFNLDIKKMILEGGDDDATPER
jgi:molybdopterin/thiamine biosynthesis adenylyltransferase